MDHKTILELYRDAIVVDNIGARLFLYGAAIAAGIDEHTIEHAAEQAHDELTAMRERGFGPVDAYH